MKKIITITVFFFYACLLYGQQALKSGTYIFKFYDDEYHKFQGICKVVITKKRVAVYAIEGCHRKKGELIDEGILLFHKSGKWIIGRKKEDVNAKEIGGCSDGPSVIDLEHKVYHSC